MILATKIQSEKGKEITKTANEFIFMELTVKKQKVGEIELYYFDDTHCLCKNSNIDKDGFCEECGMKYDKEIEQGEWLLKFRPCGNSQKEEDKPDWDIVAQGNI